MVFYGPTIFSQMDLGVPPSTLATLPWLGFSAGYALSSPIMARMNRVPQFVTFSSIMSASLLFFHGGVCALAALFVWKFVPETRGKTLLQLCSIYSSSSDSSSFSRGSDNTSSTFSSNMSDTSSVSSVSDTLSVSSYPSKSFQNSTLVEKFSSLGTQLDSSKSV